jgi:hypothetical protein
MCSGPWILLGFFLSPVVVSYWTRSWKYLIFIVGQPFFFCVLCLTSTYFFQEMVITFHALYCKYATEGVRLQGTVIKTWQTNNENDTSTYIQVLYQVGGFRYNKDFRLPKQQQQQQQQQQQPDNDQEAYTDVDLILMPGYPKSAIFYASVENVDPDFPPHNRNALPISILFTTLLTLVPTSVFLRACGAVNAWLITIVIVTTIVLCFLCAYWFTMWQRDMELHRLLYGAKPVYGERAFHIVSKDEHIPYEEFCQIDHLPRPSYGAVLQVAVEGTLWCVYFVAFLGCHLVWYGIAVPRWKRTLLKRYDSESDILLVIGSVTCKQAVMGVIVQYTAEYNRLYKKCLNLPLQVRQGMPDSPELVCLKDLPESAIYKGTSLDQQHTQIEMIAVRVQFIISGLFFMSGQIAIPAWIGSNDLESALCIAGILLVCSFVMGYVGVWIRHHAFVERELLGSTGQVRSAIQYSSTHHSTLP